MSHESRTTKVHSRRARLNPYYLDDVAMTRSEIMRVRDYQQ